MPWHWSINMVKVLSLRFQHCLEPFTILLFEMCSETRLFKHWSNPFSRVRNFGNISAMRVIFFLKMLKVATSFETLRKKLENFFCFWDNHIWIDCLKLSPVRREYLSLAVNVLTNIVKIFHITERDFLRLDYPDVEQ